MSLISAGSISLESTFKHNEFQFWILVYIFKYKKTKISVPVFVNVYEAQESITRNRFRQAGNRFLGSLKVLQIRAQLIILFWYTFVKQLDCCNNCKH